MTMLESENKKTDIEPGEVNVSQTRNEEINLLDILYIFKQQWILIVGIIILSIIASLAVINFWPKVYRAEVVLLPPLQSEIELLNLPEWSEVKVDDVYRVMLSNLRSKELQRMIFDKHRIYELLKDGEDDVAGSEIDEIFIKKFSEGIKIKESVTDKNTIDNVQVFMEGSQLEKLSQWLDDFIVMVDKFTVNALINAVNAKTEGKILQLTDQITSLRETARKVRIDKLVQLNEAKEIAGQIGLEDVADISYYSVTPINYNNDETGTDMVIEKDSPPDYLRGSKALQAEVDALKNRKDSDSFIPGLREMEGRLDSLKKLLLGKDLQIHSARIDQPALTMKKPVEPKRGLIIILGFVFGTIIASIVAIVRFSFSQYFEVKTFK